MSATYNVEVDASKRDYTYMNLQIINTTNDDIIASYNETRTRPIVDNMEEYMLSVVRMKVPTSAIPLFEFEETIDPPNPVTNPYQIAFSLQTVDPNGDIDNNLTVESLRYSDCPATTIPNDRNIYYYTQFLEMVNSALLRLWTIATTGGSPFLASIPASINTAPYAPFFRLSQGDTGIELCLPCALDNGASSPFTRSRGVGINISMSAKLFYFFNGFSAKDYKNIGGIGTALVRDARLRYKLQLTENPMNVNARSRWNNIPPANNPLIAMNVVPQDYSSLFLWQSLSRIILLTSINIDKEVVLRYDDDGHQLNMEILTDFEIPQTQKGLKEYIFFFPEGELRRMNFKSSGRLDKFDIRVYYQSNNGKIHQLYIQPNFEFSIKMQFERRKARNLLYYINPHKNDKYMLKE